MLELQVREVRAAGQRGPWTPLDGWHGAGHGGGVRRALASGELESRTRVRRDGGSTEGAGPGQVLLVGGYRCAVITGGLGRGTAAALALVARQFWPVLALAAALALLARESPAALWFLAFGAVFLAAVWVHELGHVVAFQLVTRGRGRGVLVTKGWAMHLARPPLLRGQELAVVAAGPAAPALVSVVLWWASPPTLLMAAAATVSVAHLVMLVVPVGDGANLRGALRAAG